MLRAFPILAAVAGLLMAASLGDLPGLRSSTARSAAFATLLAHGSAFAHLRLAGRRVEAASGRLGLPGWVGGLAEKNRRKALAYQGVGSAILALASWPARGRWWDPVAPAACLSFQAGAFVGEFLMIAAQSRLAGSLGSWSGPARPAEGP